MRECDYAVSLILVTTLCVLSGVVKVVSQYVCEEEVTAGAGNGVDVQATCYPNGTVSFSWHADPLMWHLQIEYQCFINGTPHEQTPRRVGGLLWSDISSGHRILSVQPWEEGTLCFLSGCYDNRRDWAYPTYRIPEAACTIHTVMTSPTVSSSHGLHIAFTSLLPTPSVSPARPDLTYSPALQHAHVTPPALLSPSPTTRSLSQTQMETYTTVQPADFQKTTVAVLPIGIAVAVAAVLFVAIMCVIAVAVIISERRKSRMWDLGMFKSKEVLDETYNPVSLQQCKIAESSDTLFEPLQTPKRQFDLESYEYTPKVYIKHTASDTVETDATSLIKNRLSDILMSPGNCSSVTESANSGAPVADNISVGTLRSMEEKRKEVVDPTEAMAEWLQEKEEEEEEKVEEEDKMEGQEMCLDGSGYVEANNDMYELLESTKCQFELPVGEFPISEPFDLDPSCGDSSSGSFCIDDAHLHSFSHTCADTSRSSGYISNQTVVT